MPIIKLEPHGPVGKGMAVVPSPAAAELHGAVPEMKAHRYFEDPALGLRAGVWRSTPYDLKMKTRGNSEFAFLLEGEVAIARPDNNTVTLKAGNAYIVPTGFRYRWTQAGDARKFYMSFDAPVDAYPGADIAVVAGRAGTAPHIAAEATNGLWSFGSARRPPSSAAGRLSIQTRHEFIHVTEGSAVLETDEDKVPLQVGSSCLLPQGTGVNWKVSDPITYIYFAIGTPALVSA